MDTAVATSQQADRPPHTFQTPAPLSDTFACIARGVGVRKPWHGPCRRCHHPAGLQRRVLWTRGWLVRAEGHGRARAPLPCPPPDPAPHPHTNRRGRLPFLLALLQLRLGPTALQVLGEHVWPWGKRVWTRWTRITNGQVVHDETTSSHPPTGEDSSVTIYLHCVGTAASARAREGAEAIAGRVGSP